MNVISGLKGASEDTEISMKGEYVEKPWPKKVAGVTIPEEDKDKMILKIRVPGTKAKIRFSNGYSTEIKIDYGDGVVRNISQEIKEFNGGEHVVKILGDYSNVWVENASGRRL